MAVASLQNAVEAFLFGGHIHRAVPQRQDSIVHFKVLDIGLDKLEGCRVADRRGNKVLKHQHIIGLLVELNALISVKLQTG